jgi:hypothetical protein
VLAADAVDLPSDVRILGPDGVAADAADPGPLADLLRRSGFLVASEREFHGRSERFDRVLARTLVFSTPAGASAYLGWLASHPDEILGPTRRLRPLGLGTDAVFFRLRPCGCHAELPTFLAAWRHGSTVRFLLAAGRQASRRSLLPIATALDRL